MSNLLFFLWKLRFNPWNNFCSNSWFKFINHLRLFSLVLLKKFILCSSSFYFHFSFNFISKSYFKFLSYLLFYLRRQCHANFFFDLFSNLFTERLFQLLSPFAPHFLQTRYSYLLKYFLGRASRGKQRFVFWSNLLLSNCKFNLEFFSHIMLNFSNLRSDKMLLFLTFVF